MCPNLGLIIEVLKLRQSALRVTVGKLERGLVATKYSDRLYDMMGYHGTHTGRPVGRMIQVLNLPKGVPIRIDRLLNDPRIVALRNALSGSGTTGLTDLPALQQAALECIDEEIPWSTEKRRKKDPTAPASTADDILASLIRPCLYSENLIICDYAAIEARGVAWMAGEESLLKLFREGGDPYVDIATQLGTTRPVGKIIILGCGYGMGEKKFQLFADISRIDLAAAGVTAKQCVATYRERYPGIVALWRRADRAIKYAVREQGEMNVGHCRVGWASGNLVVRLPSGRCLNYRNARIESRVPGYGGPAVDTVVYSPPTRRHIEDPALWGSKAIENWCQALCYDLTATAKRIAEAEGLHPVLDCYDELVFEDPPERELDVQRIMKTPPPWATGFPIDVESGCSARYKK